MQLEEDLGDDYRWSYRVTSVLFSGKSEYQEIDLVDTPTFGKVRHSNRVQQRFSSKPCAHAMCMAVQQDALAMFHNCHLFGP